MDKKFVIENGESIEITVSRGKTNERDIFVRPKAKGILQFSKPLDYFPRRKKKDDGGDGGGGGDGGTPRAAPVLTVFSYNTYVVSSGVYEGYGLVKHYRYNSANVDTNRPFAQKLQFEVSRNADFSDPHHTGELALSTNPGGYNHFTANRKFTCSGEIFQYGIHGTTQYLRARDYDGVSWSNWGTVNLVFPADYATPAEYPLEFTESCN